MNLLKKTLVAAGVATAVLATGAAQAATVNNPTVSALGVVNLVASKFVANESVKTVLDLPTVTVTLGAAEAFSVDDSVTITLSTGVFGAAGTLASTGGGTFALISGGAKSATAVYRVTGAAAVASTVTLTGATVTGTAIAANSAVTTGVAMSGFVGGAATALFSSPLTTYSMQLVPVMTAAITASAGTFDVAKGFAALTTGTGTTSATTGVSTTTGGAVITTTVGAGSAIAANTAGIPASVPAAAATLVTISGPMTGVAAITDANINPTSALGVATAGAATGRYTIDTATNTATGTQVATGGASATRISFAGTSAYDASVYTATVSRLADGAAYAANASLKSGTAFAFSRNGSSFTTNSFGALNKLTVTDRSGALGGVGADGAIAITAFDAAGAAVTCTGLTIANLPNNGTTTIQGADLTAACVGAKRIEGIVNSTTIFVSNTKITAEGATSQSGGNNTTSIAN